MHPCIPEYERQNSPGVRLHPKGPWAIKRHRADPDERGCNLPLWGAAALAVFVEPHRYGLGTPAFSLHANRGATWTNTESWVL
jgi:hypothetical protein